MQKTEMVTAEVPIVGSRRQVERALVTQANLGQLVTHPRKVRIIDRPDGKVEACVTLRVPVRVPWRKRHPTLAPILAALAWSVGAMLMLAAVIAGAIYWIARAVDRPALLGGAALVVALAVMFVFNRASHSGACAGVAVHCKGCKL